MDGGDVFTPNGDGGRPRRSTRAANGGSGTPGTGSEAESITEDMGWQSEEGLLRQYSAEGTWISQSTDNGYTWEPGYKVNSEPLRWTMPANGILELPNGTLLMAVLGQLHTRRERKDQEPIRSVLLRSDNGGLDWEHWSTIAFDPQQLAALMPDLREAATQCRFYNCTHLHEPGCGVRAALERGEINESRYRIYREIHAELARG